MINNGVDHTILIKKTVLCPFAYVNRYWHDMAQIIIGHAYLILDFILEKLTFVIYHSSFKFLSNHLIFSWHRIRDDLFELSSFGSFQ